MPLEKILIIDDELLIRSFLEETLQRQGFDVQTAENGLKGIKILEEHSFDLVITDMKMPKITGMEVLQAVKKIAPNTLVIIVTAFGSVENAVEAMHLGAFNYLIKPFSPDTIEAVIEKVKEHLALVNENQFLREQLHSGGSDFSQQLIAESPAMGKILSDVQKIAKSNASVFINGESGTGKEVIAHAIHHASHRKNSPYIRVNCAAIPENLVESEFFGHEKGAFTGAHQRRLGRFELAHTGTLLLDEITEIPIALQAKLLRILQEKEFERVGGTKAIKVDVRIISTSNRIMQEAIEEKLFREDLYYRLNVVPIDLPPLRERVEDILPLSRYFLEKFCVENHKSPKKFTKCAEKKLMGYPWPGNIRELANIIERAIVMDFSDQVAAEHLYLDSRVREAKKPLLESGQTLHEMEEQLILQTLRLNNQNRSKTATILGITTRTLRNKLNSYHIKEESSI